MRLRVGGADPSLALLVVYEQRLPASPADIAAWVAQARQQFPAATRLRTGAMYPAAAQPFEAQGFDLYEALCLLERELGPEDAARQPAHRVRRLARRHDDQAAEVDRRAFAEADATRVDRGGGSTRDDIREIRTATPTHRARCLRVDGVMAAYAISGRAGRDGFLQRLAVDPAFRRRRFAQSLVCDALAWMARHGAQRALVNTAVTNAAALRLYEESGFARTSTTLRVMQLDLRDDG